MAEVTKNVLKGYFTKGSVPTQSNYADFIDTMVSQSEMNTAISGVNSSVGNATSDIAKIAEILGKGQNETLTQLAAKFAALTGNYANVYAFVSKVKAFLEDTDATDATINRWQEIESFLSGITDSDSLTAMLADLKSEIEGNLAVDSALSATSEKALQNKVLYDELRITEQSNGAVLTVNGTNYPIVTLDADTFESKNWTDNYDSDHTVYLFPQLEANKAYYVTNVGEYEGVSKIFGFRNAGTFKIKFENTYNEFSSVNIAASGVIANPSAYEPQGSSFSNESLADTETWLSIPADTMFITRIGIIGENYQWDTTNQYYGVDGLSYTDESKLPTISNATETTGSASTIKSLKTKIAELEARLAAVPTNYLEFATDMSAYASAATGKVLLYLGTTTQDFTHGYVYEKTASGWNNLSVSPVIN